MRARAVAHQHHPAAVDPQCVGAAKQVGQCRGDIGGLLFHRGIRHQSVIDRGIGIAAGGIVDLFPPTGRVVLAAAFPAAAVDEQHQWGWALCPLGAIEIQHLQRVGAITQHLRCGCGGRGGGLAARRYPFSNPLAPFPGGAGIGHAGADQAECGKGQDHGVSHRQTPFQRNAIARIHLNRAGIVTVYALPRLALGACIPYGPRGFSAG